LIFNNYAFLVYSGEAFCLTKIPTWYILVSYTEYNRENIMCKSDNQINCKRCDTPFIPSKGFKTLCSHECKYNKRVVSEEAVQKRASRLSKKITFTCQNDTCGVSFQDKPSSRRKYCSLSCSSKHRMNNPDVKLKLRERAIEQGLGGNVSRGMHGYYISPTAGKVFLESSYEFEVAEELDRNGIRWIRPSKKDAFVYEYPEENKKRRYFPDFYLPAYDVYLDPKNNYRIKKDLRKIRLVAQTHKVRVIVLEKEKLDWDSISALIGINKTIKSFASRIKNFKAA
jgi:hypothetical protein